MDFGTVVFARPNSCGEETKLAEECGFSHAWVADTHMMSADVYMCLALMAAQTSHIKLGTGVQCRRAYRPDDSQLHSDTQPAGTRPCDYGYWHR